MTVRYRYLLAVLGGAAITALGFGIYLAVRPNSGVPSKVFAAWAYYATHYYYPPARPCLLHPPPTQKQLANQLRKEMERFMRKHPGEAFGYQHVYEPPAVADATKVGQARFLAEVACMKRRLHEA